MLLCSGRSAMGRLKDILFRGERNDFKLIIVTGAKKYVHLEGGKGPLRASFPQLTKRMEKSAAVCQICTPRGAIP